MHAFIQPFVHSCIYLFIHSSIFIDAFIDAFMHSFVRLFVRSFLFHPFRCHFLLILIFYQFYNRSGWSILANILNVWRGFETCFRSMHLKNFSRHGRYRFSWKLLKLETFCISSCIFIRILKASWCWAMFKTKILLWSKTSITSQSRDAKSDLAKIYTKQNFNLHDILL